MPDTLSAGRAHAILEDITYCLPPQVVRVQSLAAVEVSIDNSTWAVLTGSTTGAETGAIFVRCTTAATTIVCKTLR